MTPGVPPGGRGPGGGRGPVPPGFLDFLKIHFPQVRAMVYLTYGPDGVDCEKITRAAFQTTLEFWEVDQPITFIRREALELAEAATRNGQATRRLTDTSVEQVLGKVMSSRACAALRAIDHLSRERRFAFLCVEVFRLEVATVATVARKREGTVRSQLFTARRLLHEQNIDIESLRKELDDVVGLRGRTKDQS